MSHLFSVPSAARFASLAWLVALVGQNAHAQQGLPYEATVVANNVYIRSGPGTEYYPTGKLQTGETVEVYRHDPGGWCAIRPPQTSFTWVSSRFVKPLKDRLGEIVGDRVAARVGSSFSSIRDVIQVRLQKGELVEILQVSPDGAWTKIAPPSGEFRWVHRNFLTADGQASGLRKSYRGEQASSDAQPVEHANEQGLEIEPSLQFAGEAAGLDRDNGYPTTECEYSYAQTPRVVSPEEFAAELDDLNIELSMMIVEEPTVWEFGDLASRAQGLLMQAETAVERGKARILLTKIRRFEDIRDRYRKVSTLAARTETANRRHASATPKDYRASDPRESRYDGSGRLMQVQSPKSGAPRFALMDEAGRVRCFVTPAPGINMQYYLGKEIGVNGMRGYVPEQRAAHVTAKHIEILDERILR